MLENNINSIVDDGREPKGRHRNSQSTTVNRNLLTEACQPTSIFILLIVLAVLPTLQVFIGWHYITACPINPLVPHYLIIAGIVGLLLILLISVTQMMSRTVVAKMFDDTIGNADSNRAIMLIGCGICSFMCINLSLFVFLFGWTTLGWVWVVQVWHRVQYRRAERDDYCHPMLYQFTFSVLLLTTTVQLMFLFFVCKKTCQRVADRPRRNTLAPLEL